MTFEECWAKEFPNAKPYSAEKDIAEAFWDAGYEQAHLDNHPAPRGAVPKQCNDKPEIYLCKHCLGLEAMSYIYREHPGSLGASKHICEDCGDYFGVPCISTTAEYRKMRNERPDQR